MLECGDCQPDGEMLRMEKTPEFRDKWILVWFAAWFLLFFPMGMGSVPATHGAYWREVMAVPLMMGFMFTVLAGLVRPAGWASIAGLYLMGRYLPQIDSRNLQLYFWLASYFTLFFSVGERLTLGKILKVAVLTGPFLIFAYFLDASYERGGFGIGILNWFLLLLTLVVFNGLMRAGASLFQRQETSRLDWIEKHS